jgi:hypothetical protein
VRKLLVSLGFLGLSAVAAHAFATMPDNPIAFGNCHAKVKVDAARLRSAPSLESRVLGVRVQDDSLYVSKVFGKWVQVVPADGDTAYMAAYLLIFPANEILEQWKRENPSPSVGKKAKVKWAKVNFRKYPTSNSPKVGHFSQNDEVAVLTDLGNGWSLVESRKADGKGNCFGFVSNRGPGQAGRPRSSRMVDAPGQGPAPSRRTDGNGTGGGNACPVLPAHGLDPGALRHGTQSQADFQSQRPALPGPGPPGRDSVNRTLHSRDDPEAERIPVRLFADVFAESVQSR